MQKWLKRYFLYRHAHISHNTEAISFFFLFFSSCALHVSHILISALQDCNFYYDYLAYREHVLICSFDQKLQEIYVVNPDVL